MTVEQYMEDYRIMKENNKEEEWLREFFFQYIKLTDNYESPRSNLPPDAAELIGEFRERKVIVNWLREMEISHSDPLTAAAFEYAADVISKGEHI